LFGRVLGHLYCPKDGKDFEGVLEEDPSNPTRLGRAARIS
jgi:hypothetical protein